MCLIWMGCIMSVSIVNGFICVSPGPEEVMKAQKGLNPKPDLPSASQIGQAIAPGPNLKLEDGGSDAQQKLLDIRA
jgi:hypothetical protein